MINDNLELSATSNILQPFLSSSLVAMRHSYAVDARVFLSRIAKFHKYLFRNCVHVRIRTTILDNNGDNYMGNHNVS